jgi:hypothetical protein
VAQVDDRARGFADLSKIYATVLARWKQFAPFLTAMLHALETHRRGDEAIAQIRFHVFQVLEAKASFDGTRFYQCYHRLL